MNRSLASQKGSRSVVGLAELPDLYAVEVGVITVDARARISEISPAVGGLLDVKASAFVHRPLAELLARVCIAPLVEQILEAVQRARSAWQVSAFELQFPRGETENTFVKLHISALGNRRSPEPSAVLIFQDTTAYRRVGLAGLAHEDARRHTELIEQATRLEQQKERYRQEAIHDGLTGLYNYAHFHVLLTDEVTRARRYGHPLALLMIDVDDFKSYNDSYGHVAGNWALRHVAAILQRTSRQTDRVARYGGEEFAVILPETNMGGALGVAERMRFAVEHESRTAMGFRRPLTVSVGVASYPRDVDSPQELVLQKELILRADERLYRAKAAGKNGVFGLAETAAITDGDASADLCVHYPSRRPPP